MISKHAILNGNNETWYLKMLHVEYLNRDDGIDKNTNSNYCEYAFMWPGNLSKMYMYCV